MSEKSVVEGHLLFEFDETWGTILQWDKHPAYHDGIKKLEGSKAVDIVGVRDSGLVVFIEVKDFRIHDRSKPMSLWAEFELKVRNTAAGLLGARRQERYALECEPILRSLLKPHELRLVFWIEQSPASGKIEVLRKRHSVAAGTAMKKVVKRVKWLDARVVHASQEDDYAQLVPGLKVKNLPRRRRELAEAIVARLEQRGMDIGDDVRNYICLHLIVRDLEEWLERAAEVSTVEELFGGRR